VYALVALGKDNEYSDWLNDYHDRCVQAQTSYQKVFYLTAGHFAPVEDGVRGINKHYSRLVDLAMLDYTSSMTAEDKIFIVTTPDLKIRKDFVYWKSAIHQQPNGEKQ
jgi:hypothetical protein